MDQVKDLKRGDLLFKEGEKITHVYVVQSGKVSLFLERSGRKIEIMEGKTSHVMGEAALFTNNAKHLLSAEAAGPCKILEVPIEVMKAQVDSSQPGVKLVVKSLVEGTKQNCQAIRSLKMDKDNSPCPQFSIPTLFCVLALVAKNSGHPVEGQDGHLQLDWTTVKIYTTRMFRESLSRVQHVVELLKKLGKAEMRFEKNEDEIDELVSVTLFDVQLLEDFAEFYQYNLYKPGKSEIIYVDPLALKVARALVELGKDLETDFRGAVRMEYDKLLKDVKEQFRFDLKSLHLDALEKKGLFVKRQSTDKGEVFLSFDKVEFQDMLRFWQIIAEIDKWNEKGFVDLNEKAEEEAVDDKAKCPACQGEITDAHNFCPSCGHKLAA
ncbi:MAG: cyclic nucleotide-binding domain-containing protein [Bdellovibrionaceae bacterium]|nr:cyclic nucleotide-binding domain-containing protein [Bdellovibrionales bacterium]MCB9084105.1 cyclic nucleotide-binding domain-containing protein [Pseudobdellovibrionaceae bacterium]